MTHSPLIFDLAETVEQIPVGKSTTRELKMFTCRYYLTLKTDWLAYRSMYQDDPICFNEFCKNCFLTSRGNYNPSLN